MKRILIGCLRLVLGTLLLWFTVIVAQSFFRLSWQFSDRATMLWCLGGAVVGSLLFSQFHFTPVYVFGHELTHWVLAKLFCRRTSRFTVHLNSGSVRVDNPNIVIILGPYILPIYMLLLMSFYGLIGLAAVWSRPAVLTAAVLFGLAYAYHLVMTVVALSQHQPDLQFNGPVFSLIFIIFFNLLFLYLGIALAEGHGVEALKISGQLLQEQASWLLTRIKAMF